MLEQRQDESQKPVIRTVLLGKWDAIRRIRNMNKYQKTVSLKVIIVI